MIMVSKLSQKTYKILFYSSRICYSCYRYVGEKEKKKKESKTNKKMAAL